MVNDGQQDYAYLDPGAGAAPYVGYSSAFNTRSYLTSDLLGSVRLATNSQDVVLGAGAYDPWGTALPNTQDDPGTTALAGLQALTPFGYAGQPYDQGPGTDDMRARQRAGTPSLPLGRRLQTHAPPDPTCREEPVGVEPQEGGGGTSDRRRPDDHEPFRIPGKMVGPALPAGVEERHLLAVPGIGRCTARSLEFVAAVAGEAQVLGVRGAARH